MYINTTQFNLFHVNFYYKWRRGVDILTIVSLLKSSRLLLEYMLVCWSVHIKDTRSAAHHLW